ncbi:transmembrane sensor [Pedobacter africanus]|uniref:Uncharacterized protein n=1 Tax=Pedobacter africanus TaxID=151894 RepID=A0ACC6KVH8_9SPHI|nr:FecR domain-containing protein [Pedobacter africanus]MDR6783339.1 hypothetical protein [Pedobacter africanus]
MDKHTITYLYRAYLADSLDAHELEMFRKLVFESNPELEALIDGDWNRVNGIQVPLDVKEQVLEFIVSHKQEPIRKSIWPRMTAIAASIVIVLMGVYFFTVTPGQKFGGESQYVTDVAPGKQGATLTLANGKRIRLSDVVNGEIAQEAGVRVNKAEDGQLIYEITGLGKTSPDKLLKMNTLSTANGETYRLRLPDGSLVWLNSASSLTYAANLIDEQGQRAVKLTGEGYFEVFKDKKHPFIVKTDKQEVEVLGTHFNINSYSDEPIVATTLIEGAVKVNSSSGEQLLKPGQQAINDGATIKVAAANLENITDWKGGDFYFNGVDFKTAMRKIGRWYDVEIIYDITVPANIEAGGWISRSKKLSDVLKFIESLGIVRFKLEGKKVYVMK